MMYKPYSYLIGWTRLNIWYYGVEYGIKTKTANPKNLWKTYFTSSRNVKLAREFYGEPDIITTRKLFTNAEAALKWEETVLRRMNVIKSRNWLNENSGGSIRWANNAGNRKPRTEKQKESARKSLTLTMKNIKNNPFLGKKHTKTSIDKMKSAMQYTTCPHCGRSGIGNSMIRWHFDKCKSFI